MKVQQARSKDTSNGKICRICASPIKAGQYFTERRMPNNPITDRWFTMHVRCMRAIADNTPVDDDPAARQTEKSKANFEALRSKGFTALRDEILSTQ